MKKKVFISFDFENDQFLRDAFVAHGRNSDTPFELEDWSVKVPWDERTWKEQCLIKIKKCDLVIVILGEKTHTCSGVKAEIQMAREAGVPVVSIVGYKEKTCPAIEGLKRYRWTWENVGLLLNGNR
ncbi:MAG: TIR domain-containing protein [Candidatus Gracilibacteria bacterium]|jgi:hypothetical protein